MTEMVIYKQMKAINRMMKSARPPQVISVN